MTQLVKNLPAMQETQEVQVSSLGWEDPLEEEMANHSSILACRAPGETGGGSQSPGSHEELDTTEQLSKHLATVISCPIRCKMGLKNRKRRL